MSMGGRHPVSMQTPTHPARSCSSAASLSGSLSASLLPLLALSSSPRPSLSSSDRSAASLALFLGC